jgi:hypothetical protein
MNDDRLRQVLWKGDPAVQDAGLSPDEVHAMRRTVLTAIPESRRWLAWLPLLTAGTAVLILLALVFGPWHRPAVVPIVPPGAPRMATVVTPDLAPPESPEPAVSSEKLVKSPRPAHRRGVRRPQPPPVLHDEPMTMASLPDTLDSSIREIRFSTPGGTRIIWELSGGDAR